MSLIVTTDIHLTDAPHNSYRWRIFDFLKQRARDHRRRHEVPRLIICGDMTEKKEGHSEQLVNRFVQEIVVLGDYFRTIDLMRGNHDYKLGDASFFRFLRFMPHVTWAESIYFARDGVTGRKFVLVPHGYEIAKLRKAIAPEKPDFVFLHHTFNGAKAANGFELQPTHGGALSQLRGIKARIFSGDIHTRQKCGPVDYIGTPYPIDFDEDHACRVIEIDEMGKVTSVPTNIIRKHMLTVVSKRDLVKQLRATSSGDQVKVRWRMSTADISRASELYHAIVEACTEASVVLAGGVEYIFDEHTGPHTLQFDGEKGDVNAQRTVQQIFAEFVKVRRLREPLAKTGRKIVRGKK